MHEGAVADDTRIRAALPTISFLREHGAKVVLFSHLGRPDGKVDDRYSLQPVADRLTELLDGTRCRFASDCIGWVVEVAIERMSAGDVLLCQNVRFHAEEEANAP